MVDGDLENALPALAKALELSDNEVRRIRGSRHRGVWGRLLGAGS